MSFFMVPNEIINTRELTTYEKIVYIALLYYTNHKKGYCCPSHQEISICASTSVSTVKRALSALANKQYISIEPSGRLDGRNLYVCHITAGSSSRPGTWVAPPSCVGRPPPV